MALAAIIISFCAPTPHIRIENRSKQSICYRVEYSDGTGAIPKDTDCGIPGDGIAGFWLRPSQQSVYKAINATGQPFNGAITAIINNEKGARNEINFSNTTMPYYDVDYQYGISDGTCGPPNSTREYLAGEKDALGKANIAWRSLNQTTQKSLLDKGPQYLYQGPNGSLTHINMSIDAWPDRADVIQFFQLTAGFKAYMSPGSVGDVTWPTNSLHAKLVDLANQQTRSALTDMIVVTSY